MASNKRRRSININTAYIDNLQVKAEVEGTTATGLASQIFIGLSPPLTSIECAQKTKGISMTEAMWLSIRHRAERVGRPTSHVAQDILAGKNDPLSQTEIDVGLTLAGERESKRAYEYLEKATRVAAKRAEEECEKQLGVFVGPLAYWDPRSIAKDSDVKVSGDEKAPDDSKKENLNIIVQEPDISEQKRRVRLSIGQPVGSKDQNEKVAKEAKPDEESYGGYFQF